MKYNKPLKNVPMFRFSEEDKTIVEEASKSVGWKLVFLEDKLSASVVRYWLELIAYIGLCLKLLPIY